MLSGISKLRKSLNGLDNTYEDISNLFTVTSNITFDTATLSRKVTNLEISNISITSRVSILEASNISTFNRVITLESSNLTVGNRLNALESSNILLFSNALSQSVDIGRLQASNILNSTRITTLETANVATQNRVTNLELNNVTVWSNITTQSNIVGNLRTNVGNFVYNSNGEVLSSSSNPTNLIVYNDIYAGSSFKYNFTTDQITVTYSNCSIVNNFGKLSNSSIYFNGSNSYAIINDIPNVVNGNANVTTWTMEFWAYPQPLGGFTLGQEYDMMASGIGNGQRLFEMRLLGSSSTTANFFPNTNQVNVNKGPYGLTANNWIHVAYTFDGNSNYVFCNGQFVNGGLSVYGNSWRFYNRIYLGAILSGSSFSKFFRGYISDIRICVGQAYTYNVSNVYTMPTTYSPFVTGFSNAYINQTYFSESQSLNGQYYNGTFWGTPRGVGNVVAQGNIFANCNVIVNDTLFTSNCNATVSNTNFLNVIGNVTSSLKVVTTSQPSIYVELPSTSGTTPATNGIYVNNVGTGSTAHAITCLRVNGVSGGDPYMSWDCNGYSGFSLGIDSSDSRSLKLKGAWDFTDNSYYDIFKVDINRNTYFYNMVSIRSRFIATLSYAGSYTSGNNINFSGSLQDLSGTASVSSGILTLPSFGSAYYSITFSGRASDGTATQGIQMYAGVNNLLGSSDGVFWLPVDSASRRTFCFHTIRFLSASTQIRATMYASTTFDVVKMDVTYLGTQS